MRHQVEGLTLIIDPQLAARAGDLTVSLKDTGLVRGMVVSSANPVGVSCGPA